MPHTPDLPAVPAGPPCAALRRPRGELSAVTLELIAIVTPAIGFCALASSERATSAGQFLAGSYLLWGQLLGSAAQAPEHRGSERAA